MEDLDYLNDEPEEKDEGLETPWVNKTISDETKEAEKIEAERKQAEEDAKRDQVQRIAYSKAADKVWAEAKKLDLDPYDQEVIEHLLSDGELDIATKKVQIHSTKQQQAKDLRALEEGFVAGIVSYGEYEKRMREAGKL